MGIMGRGVASTITGFSRWLGRVPSDLAEHCVPSFSIDAHSQDSVLLLDVQPAASVVHPHITSRHGPCALFASIYPSRLVSIRYFFSDRVAKVSGLSFHSDMCN